MCIAAALFYANMVGRWRSNGVKTPPVSLLKPLSGDSSAFETALRSFCEQDYPEFEIIFGVAKGDKSTASFCNKLINEFPDVKIRICEVDQNKGGNRKVASLETLAENAKQDVLLWSDADMIVAKNHIQTIVVSLMANEVGAVTCPYIGMPGSGVWSALGAMWIDYDFTPLAVLSKRLGLAQGCFGSTIAMRRSTLGDIGGFARFRHVLADDYAVGAAVRKLGLKSVFAPIFAETLVTDSTLGQLWSRELRWQRTIRMIEPKGHAASIIKNSTSIGLIGLLLSGFASWAMLTFVLLLASRYAYAAIIDSVHKKQRSPNWILPLRDLMTFIVFITSLFGNRVNWNGRAMNVSNDGALIP